MNLLSPTIDLCCYKTKKTTQFDLLEIQGLFEIIVNGIAVTSPYKR